MSTRRDELLKATIAFLVAHGVANLSLRPLAAAIGTSARLLIFHFGSKEGLLNEVFKEVHARLRSILSAPVATASALTSVPPMMQFWQRIAARENLPYWRLLYEVHFIALQNPDAFGKSLAETSVSLTKWIESQLPPALSNPEMATLVGATLDGLMMELITTGDLRRTTQSLQLFIEILRAASAASAGASMKRRQVLPSGKRRGPRGNSRRRPT